MIYIELWHFEKNVTSRFTELYNINLFALLSKIKKKNIYIFPTDDNPIFQGLYGRKATRVKIIFK